MIKVLSNLIANMEDLSNSDISLSQIQEIVTLAEEALLIIEELLPTDNDSKELSNLRKEFTTLRNSSSLYWIGTMHDSFNGMPPNFLAWLRWMDFYKLLNYIKNYSRIKMQKKGVILSQETSYKLAYRLLAILKEK